MEICAVCSFRKWNFLMKDSVEENVFWGPNPIPRALLRKNVLGFYVRTLQRKETMDPRYFFSGCVPHSSCLWLGGSIWVSLAVLCPQQDYNVPPSLWPNHLLSWLMTIPMSWPICLRHWTQWELFSVLSGWVLLHSALALVYSKVEREEPKQISDVNLQENFNHWNIGRKIWIG